MPEPVLDGSVDSPPRPAKALDSARTARAVYAFFLLAPLPWVLVYFLPPINHDAAALLHFSSRWLAGERLYVDLIDINPPLIFVLNLLPAALDRLTPLSGPTALTICTLAWIGVGFVNCMCLLAARPEQTDDVRRYVLPPLLLVLMLAFPGTEFSQREHLMIVAALPYLMLAESRMLGLARPRGLVMTIALFAALGFALKPHFLLLPVLIEAAVLVAIGWRRLVRDPVPWAMGLVFACYALFIVTVTPRYLDSVVPLAMDQYTALGGLGPWGVLFRSDLTATAALLVLLAGAALLTRRPLAKIAALAAIAGVVVAMVQAKGWPYHLLPAESFVLMLAAVLLCDAVDAHLPAAAPQRRPAKILVLISLMVGAYYVSALVRPTFARQAGFEQNQVGQILVRYGRDIARGPMLVLSPGIYPHFPTINYAGGTMGMRFMSLWAIQGAYAKCLDNGRMFRAPGQMSATEAYAFNAVVEDMEKFRPRLVVVDRIPGIPKCGQDEFDFLAYFRQSPRFEAAWRNYRPHSHYERYRVFTRD